jgi:DNA mismatch endonuclease, patch repair protein
MDEKNYIRDKRSPVPKSNTVSKVMSSIKASNTKPEMLLRNMLYNTGNRGYRKNFKDLPGKPDIVYTKQKVAIFINGCYWHGCEQCGWKPPKHNSEYWVNKITKNRQRDIAKKENLERLGFTVITVWEHEIKSDLGKVVQKIQKSLQKSLK